MIINVDLTQIPPVLELLEGTDFKSLKLVTVGEHARVPRETLLDLAGELASDPAWLKQFDSMLDYAREHGWTDELGATRVHIERSI